MHFCPGRRRVVGAHGRRAHRQRAAGAGRARRLAGDHLARRVAAGVPLRDRHRARRGAGRRVVRFHDRLARVDPPPRPDRLPRAVPGDRTGNGGVDPAHCDARGVVRCDRAVVGQPADRRLRVRRGDAGRRRLRLGHAVQGGPRQRLLARRAAGVRVRQLPRRDAPRGLARARQPAAGVAARQRSGCCRRCCCSSRSSARWPCISGRSAARASTRAGGAARSTSAPIVDGAVRGAQPARRRPAVGHRVRPGPVGRQSRRPGSASTSPPTRSGAARPSRRRSQSRC